jgi:alpha-glucosidase
LLVREGSAIAMNIAEQSFDRRGDTRAFAIFAPADGAFEATCHEDDGETAAEGHGSWQLNVRASAEALTVDCCAEGPRPPVGPIALLLRPNEVRPVQVPSGRVTADRLDGAWRRIDLAP